MTTHIKQSYNECTMVVPAWIILYEELNTDTNILLF
jgi:hypothetical protein